MRNYINKYWNKLKEIDGATAIEYALIASLVGVGLVTALGSLTTGIEGSFTNVTNAL